MEMASEDTFAYLSLSGDRFDAVGMPADAAIEVRNYREAVYAIARELWLRDNSERSRVPNGFPTAFDLRLTGINPGSAQPVLQLHRPIEVSEDEFTEWADFYGRARDLLTQSIAAVSVGAHELPKSFPKSAVRQIRRLGSSLDSDETMVVGGTAEGAPRAELDQAVRAVISQINATIGEDPVEVAVDGIVIEANSLKRSFMLRRHIDGVVVSCKITDFQENLARVMKNSLSVDGLTGPDVHVVGIADNGDEKLYRSLSDVSVIQVLRTVNQKNLLARLSHMAGLKDGWWGGNGRKVDPALIHQAETMLMSIRGPIDGLMVGPSRSGAVVFEWRKESLDLTVEIRDAELMMLCADNTSTDDLQERAAALNVQAAAEFLATGVIR